jgi:MFS family permease
MTARTPLVEPRSPAIRPSWVSYLTMNVYWLGLAFLWNALHPIILPALLLTMAPDALKNTYLGILTFAGLAVATVVQPLTGALSDRTASRWGRRRPWMVAGTLLAVLCLAAMVGARSFQALLATYVLLQVFSNSAHGPAQGLIPDLVPAARRGLASGIKNFFDMGGLIIASLVAGQLMGSGDVSLVFAAIMAVLAASTLITVVFTAEPHQIPADRAAAWRLADVLRIDADRYPAYTRLIAGRFLVLLGIYAVQAFAQYFIRDRLAVANAPQVTGNLMAVIGIALVLLVLPAGLLSDRVGRLRLNLISGGLAALGIFLLVFARSVASLYVFGAIIGMATGIFLSVNWALATDLIPLDEAGKYLGLSNIATAGAGAASRLAGPVIDGLNALWPGAFLGYPTLFVLAALSALAGVFVMRAIPEQPVAGAHAAAR